MPKPNRFLSLFLSFSLIFEQAVFAQIIDLSHYFARNSAQTMPQGDKFRPLHLRYISYDSQANDFKVLLDKGDFFNQKTEKPKNEKTLELEKTTQELLKYFFIGLALPNDKFWVNLRPDSPDDILDPDLEKTDIGRIFLEADVQLKQDTSGMTSPQTKEGKEYWDKLYKKAQELFGSENITIPTLTRPWIVPDEVIIRESPEGAYIYKATLKVMLEEDYLSRGRSRTAPTMRTAPTYQQYAFNDPRLKELNQYSTQLIKETIIPKLTRQINTSRRYAPLRQVYYSLILAQWFKQKYGPGSPVSSLRSEENSYTKLMDSGNLTNLTSSQPYDKQIYFQQYQKSFKDGEYNLQEQIHTPMGQSIRRYMSGGMMLKISSSSLTKIEAPKALPPPNYSFVLSGKTQKTEDDNLNVNIGPDTLALIKELLPFSSQGDKLRRFNTIPQESITVNQSEYVIVNPKNKHPRFLQTLGLGPCIGLILYDKVNKVALIAHLDNSCTRESLIAIMNLFIGNGGEWKHLKAALTGGNNDTEPEFLEMIRTALKLGDAALTEIIFDDAGVKGETSLIGGKSESFVLDTETWQVGRIAKDSVVLIPPAEAMAFHAMKILMNSDMPLAQRLFSHPIISDREYVNPNPESTSPPSLSPDPSDLDTPSASSAAESVQDRMKTVIRKIHPFIKGAGSFNDWQKGDDPFIISPGTIIKRAEVMLGERVKKTSLHLGSGGSVLPIVDALLGFSVIVTDLNMTAMRDVITIADKLQQEIKDAGGEIIFRKLDLLKLIGEAKYLIAPEQEEFVKEILSKNSVGHVTMTNVFNWAGDILSRHKERICIAILSLLKKSGGTFTISSDMVIGQENFFDELIGIGNKYVEIELGRGTVVPYSFILYILQKNPYVTRGDDNTTNSSSAASDDKGGIDLSRINKSIRAESVSSSAFSGGNSPVDVDFDLNEELTQLQQLLNAEIVPSADRLNRYARAACSNSLSSPELADSVLSLVAETFRLQEEKAVSDRAGDDRDRPLQELAAWLEQGS